jgi:hypothetical protein
MRIEIFVDLWFSVSLSIYQTGDTFYVYFSLMTNHGQFVIAQTCFFLSFNIHNKNSNLGKRTPVLDIYEDFMGGELFI